MATNRARSQITHTPEIEHALEVAGRKWPGDRPSRLLQRLILIGADAVEQDTRSDAAQRRQQIHDLAGKYADAFGPNYLEQLREGWPE